MEDNAPCLHDYDNYNSYIADVESYVTYNSDSPYGKCLEEIEESTHGK